MNCILHIILSLSEMMQEDASRDGESQEVVCACLPGWLAVGRVREEATPGEVTLLVDLSCVTDLTHSLLTLSIHHSACQHLHMDSTAATVIYSSLTHTHTYTRDGWLCQRRAVWLVNLIHPLRVLSRSFELCGKNIDANMSYQK